MAQLIFWTAALLLLHTYFLYPLTLFLLDGVQQVLFNIRFMRTGEDRRSPRNELWPSVSLADRGSGSGETYPSGV